MNCETFESQLLDLVYGELDEPAAKDARSHLDGCASCKTAFEKLSFARKAAAQLAPMDAPSGIDDVVMRSARARARDFAAAHPRAAAAAEAESEGGLWRSVVRFLGGFAMGPQVAMATVFVLVVAIGLWSLPNLRNEETPDEGGTVVEADTGGEVVRSPDLLPADPIQLHLDPRAGRVRGEGEEPPVQRAVRPSDDTVATGDRPATVRDREEENGVAVETAGRVVAEGFDDRARDGLAANDRDQVAEPPPSPVTPDVERSIESGERLALDEPRGRDLQREGRRAPPTEAPAFGAGLREEAQQADEDEGMAYRSAPNVYRQQGQQQAPSADSRGPVVATAPAQAPRPTPAPAAPPPQPRADPSAQTTGSMPERAPSTAVYAGGGGSAGLGAGNTTRAAGGEAGAGNTVTAPGGTSATARGLYDRGMARYRSRDWEGAIEDFSSATRRPEGRDLVPNALHHIARSHRQAGRARAATTQYESLLARHPSYVGAGAAMIELSETYRTMGNLGAARIWLARAAERYPSVAVDARRRLAVIDAQIRAGEAVRATNREAAAAEVEAEAATAPAATSD
jgi:TolA-binding protein